MNNPTMYDIDEAGGIPYPETQKYYYDKWFTTSGLTDGDAYRTIRFNVRTDTALLHWYNAFLVLDGKLVKNEGDAEYADGDLITLTHNAVPLMFSNVKLTIGNKLVENVNEVGHVSSMMYDVLYPRSKGKCDGLEFMWYPDTSSTAVENDNKGFKIRRNWIITQPHTNGKFKLKVPLHLFCGFFENFVALKGYPIELEMVRGSDDQAIFRAAAADQGKLKFSRITLHIPIVHPNNEINLRYLKLIKEPKPWLFTFRERHGMFAPVPDGIQDFQQPICSTYYTERPQMIFVGFQTNCNTTDQTVNKALYNNANVESMYVQMNNSQIPYIKEKAVWTENDDGFFYQMQQHCRANYLQYPARYTEGNMLHPVNFRTLYTIYCFDVSKLDMELGSNNVTCELVVRFAANTPANLRVYIAWVNDRTIEFMTDGSPLNIRREVSNYSEG